MKGPSGLSHTNAWGCAIDPPLWIRRAGRNASGGDGSVLFLVMSCWFGNDAVEGCGGRKQLRPRLHDMSVVRAPLAAPLITRNGYSSQNRMVFQPLRGYFAQLTAATGERDGARCVLVRHEQPACEPEFSSIRAPAELTGPQVLVTPRVVFSVCVRVRLYR